MAEQGQVAAIDQGGRSVTQFGQQIGIIRITEKQILRTELCGLLHLSLYSIRACYLWRPAAASRSQFGEHLHGFSGGAIAADKLYIAGRADIRGSYLSQPVRLFIHASGRLTV